MGVTRGVVAPHLSTPAADSRASRSAALPDDILAEQARRIVLFSGVATFVWGFGVAMDGWILPATLGIGAVRSALILESMATAVNFAVFLWLRLAHVHRDAKCRVGVWVMLLNAAFISIFEILNIEIIANGIGRPGLPS